MSIWASAICMMFGAIFIFIAAVGMWRMPDLLMRMHAATKAGTLGVGLILIGVMFKSHEIDVMIEAALTIVFIFITVPIASHLLARAAYLRGLKLTKSTCVDELKTQIKKI